MSESLLSDLVCVVCGREVAPEGASTCPDCGLEGILDARYDLGRAARSMTPEALQQRAQDIWRYSELLPLHPDGRRPPQPVGWTPIIDAPRLAARLGIAGLALKDEGRNPTASFKDRASAVGVAHALQTGAATIACASTGNAASSLAGMAAGVGLPAIIFVPARAPLPKIAQLRIFGARVFRVDGTYEQAWDLCQAACERYGWYNRNCAVNPWLVEGKKTAGLEIAEQLRADIPDWVVVSVGDGCTIAGVAKGLQEMHSLGFIPRVPRLLGVQAEGARPIVDAFAADRALQPVAAETCADSIAVGHPRNWRKAVQRVRSCGGSFVAVSDAQIYEALRSCARLAGVFGEPAGVAGIAGLARAREQGIVAADERALVVVTGSGLKDVDNALAAAGPPQDIAADLEALAEVLTASGD